MSEPSPSLSVSMWPAWRKGVDNPFSLLLALGLTKLGHDVQEMSAVGLLRRRWDVVHVHWPEHATGGSLPLATLRALCVLMALRWSTWRGAKLVWTAHNDQPHVVAHLRLTRWYLRQFDAMVDGVTYLDEVSVSSVTSCRPRLRPHASCLTPIGSYSDALPNPPRQREARAELGITTDSVIAWFGQIRAGKGIAELVRSITDCGKPSVTLVVAGRPVDRGLAEQVSAAASGSDNVILLLRHVSARTLVTIVAATDLVVLPFDSVLNSSSVTTAVSLGRPVLTNDTPEMRGLQDRLGTDVIHLSQDPTSPAAILPLLEQDQPEIHALLPDWADTAAALERMYSKLLA